MATLSALVITLNEAANIEACLESVKWANEIIVIDSGSTDNTWIIAQRYTDQVVSHQWSSHSAQKNFGDTLCTSDWILSVDADERVTPELQSEIQSVLQNPRIENEFAGYRIPIRDWMFGRFVDHGSWPHQQHVRLYRRGNATWEGAIHEGVRIDGKVGQLSNPMLHYSHTTISQFIEKLNRYTETEAEELFNRGIHIRLVSTLIGTTRAFLGQYVRLQGFRDGGHGLILAFLMALYYFVTRAKVWSMWYMREHPPK